MPVSYTHLRLVGVGQRIDLSLQLQLSCLQVDALDVQLISTDGQLAETGVDYHRLIIKAVDVLHTCLLYTSRCV